MSEKLREPWRPDLPEVPGALPQDLPLASAGIVTVPGQERKTLVGVGAPGTMGRRYLVAPNAAIPFHATVNDSAADLAATYEEGTYTPELRTADLGSTVPDFAVRSGVFTRFGRLCFFTAFFDNVAGGVPGSGVGELELRLPIISGVDQLGSRVAGAIALNKATWIEVVEHYGPAANYVALERLVPGTSDLVPLLCQDFDNDLRQISIVGRFIVDNL